MYRLASQLVAHERWFIARHENALGGTALASVADLTFARDAASTTVDSVRIEIGIDVVAVAEMFRNSTNRNGEQAKRTAGR